MTAPPVPPGRLVEPDFHRSGGAPALWRWMREHAPVHWHRPGTFPGFWSLTRYADVRAVYRDAGTFSSAHGVLLRPAALGPDPGSGLTLALTDPPRHKVLRSLLAPPFAERGVRELEPYVRATARALLVRAVEQGGCDLAQDVAARLSLSVICRLLGVPRPDQDMLVGWTAEAFAAARPLTAHPQLMAYFVELMYQRMEQPTADLVGRLVDSDVGGTLLTEKEILLNVENLVGATENAGLSMAGGLLALLEHPQQWRRLQDDPGLLPAATEEVLRWTSSAVHSMRMVTEPTEVCGQRLDRGAFVVLWLPSANRDPVAFPDPDRFDVARRPNRHLALGTGEHVCIGSTMARVQTRILLAELLDLRVQMELAEPVVPVRSIAVSGPEHLVVRVRPARGGG